MLGLGLNLSKSIGPTGWTPADLPSLDIWYKHDTDIYEDADDAAEDGDAVTQWNDQSGNDKHATASADHPTYSSDETSIDFSDTSKVFVFPTGDYAAAFSIYMRLKYYHTDITNADIFVNDSSASDFLKVQSASEIRLKIGGGSNRKFTPDPTLSTSGYVNIGLERNGSNIVAMYQAGAAQTLASGSSTYAGTFSIDRFKGGVKVYVKEVVVTTAALSTADRALLETHLSAIP